MSKFQVGDIVSGTNTSGVYSVTSDRMTKGEVIKLCGSGDFEVRVVEHTNGDRYVGQEHVVHEQYFNLVTSINTKINPMGAKEVVKDVDKVDIQLAADCTTDGYYGLLTKSRKAFFLIKVGGKWVWASASGDTNYTLGDTTFKKAMERALEFDDNFVAFYENQKDLFMFMAEPEKYHKDLPKPEPEPLYA